MKKVIILTILIMSVALVESYAQLDTGGLYLSSGYHNINIPDSTGSFTNSSSFAAGFGAKGFFRKKNNNGNSTGGLPGFILDFTISDYSYLSSGLTYNFFRGRVQVPVGIMYSLGFKKFEEDVDEATMNSVLGSVGVQLYLSNTIWLSLEGRYRIGKYKRTVDEVGTQFDREFSNSYTSSDLMLRLGYAIFQ